MSSSVNCLFPEGGVVMELLRIVHIKSAGSSKMANDPGSRLVLLGNPGVGKSALVVRFITKRFIWEYDPTLEYTYRHNLCIDDEDVMMEILDTAGGVQGVHQEGNIFWGEGFVFVYSINDRDSFDQIPHLHEYVRSLKKRSDIPSVIVGNKNDLDHERRVSFEEGEQLALDLSCVFFECSACDGGETVNDVFIDLHHSIARTKCAKHPRRRSSAQQVIQVLNKMFTKINS